MTSSTRAPDQRRAKRLLTDAARMQDGKCRMSKNGLSTSCNLQLCRALLSTLCLEAGEGPRRLEAFGDLPRLPVSRCGAPTNDVQQQRLVAADHYVETELRLHVLPAAGGVDIQIRRSVRHLRGIGAHVTVHAILHELRHGTAREGKHRCATRHRLDHDEPEGLIPLDRKEQCERASE